MDACSPGFLWLGSKVSALILVAITPHPNVKTRKSHPPQTGLMHFPKACPETKETS